MGTLSYLALLKIWLLELRPWLAAAKLRVK